jgi:acetyl-CoA C-acetyltransferase
MTEAVIVSTARTGLAKSWKRRLQHDLRRHAGRPCRAARRGARGHRPRRGRRRHHGLATFGEGTTGGNVARQIALRAGLPVTTAGMTVNRFCSSGLQTIAMAAQRIIAGEGQVYVAGGVESISCVQNEANTHMRRDPWLVAAQARDLLEHAADRRDRWPSATASASEAQDEYGVRSQQRAAAAAGRRASSRTRSPPMTDHHGRGRQGHRPPSP